MDAIKQDLESGKFKTGPRGQQVPATAPALWERAMKQRVYVREAEGWQRRSLDVHLKETLGDEVLQLILRG
jgi:hypothetical protein